MLFPAPMWGVSGSNPLIELPWHSKVPVMLSSEPIPLNKSRYYINDFHSMSRSKIDKPLVSALVCTRNRGESIVPTIESILQNDFSFFEVIIIDQSTDDRTESALSKWLNHTYVKYISSDSIGKSRALNLGLTLAAGEFVLITDDDCIVPVNWISSIVDIFLSHPEVAIAFCNVTAAPHDASKGFVPAYERIDDYIASSIREKNKVRGIGAGLAVRKQAVQEIGGFDEQLGPGTEFGDCEDGDLAVRILLTGWSIYETNRVSVIHYGFRTWEEGKRLTARNWTGIGAAYVKPLKIGYWQMLPIIAYESIGVALIEPLSNLIRFKKPKGLKQFFYFCRGFLKGFEKQVDKELIIYKSGFE